MTRKARINITARKVGLLCQVCKHPKAHHFKDLPGKDRPSTVSYCHVENEIGIPCKCTAWGSERGRVPGRVLPLRTGL